MKGWSDEHVLCGEIACFVDILAARAAYGRERAETRPVSVGYLVSPWNDLDDSQRANLDSFWDQWAPGFTPQHLEKLTGRGFLSAMLDFRMPISRRGYIKLNPGTSLPSQVVPPHPNRMDPDLELPPINTILRVKVVTYTCHDFVNPPIRMCRVRSDWGCALEYFMKPEDKLDFDPRRFGRTDLNYLYSNGGLIENLTETWQLFWKAIVIQRRWRRVITDPAFSACRRRLLREYSRLTSTP
jgi:hypothetical protein